MSRRRSTRVLLARSGQERVFKKKGSDEKGGAASLSSSSSSASGSVDCAACETALEKSRQEGRSTLPTYLSSGSLDSPRMVSVNAQLFKIVSVEDSSENITIDLGISFEWHDPFLAEQGNGKMYSSHPHIKRMHGMPMELWPERQRTGTYFFDPAWKILGASSTKIIRDISNVTDARTGHVHQFVQCIVTFPHPMKLAYFPFDVQEVEFTIGSEHDASRVVFVEDHNRISKIFEGAGNSEWAMLAHEGVGGGGEKMQLRANFAPDMRKAEAGSRARYAMCSFSFKMQRKHMWYINDVILVSFTVVSASFSAFVVGATKESGVSKQAALGDRLAIVFTTWLLLISIKFVVADRLPKISYPTILDYYMRFSYMVLFAMVVYFVLSSGSDVMPTALVPYLPSSHLQSNDISVMWSFFHVWFIFNFILYVYAAFVVPIRTSQ